MTYATELVQRYRLALRDLWNYHFWADPSLRGWESARQFNTLKVPIFSALVLSRLAPDAPPATSIFGNSFKLVPRLAGGLEWRISSLYIDIGFENRPGNQWVPCKGPYGAEQVSLTLLDVFEWEELSWRDLRYFRVRIDALAGGDDKVGREALVDNTEVDVLWNPPDITGLPPEIAEKRAQGQNNV